MTKLNEVLNFDTFSEAERIVGKPHEEFNDDEQMFALALHAQHSENKRTMLQESNDTHFSMKWEEFKKLMLLNGFSIGMSYKFINKGIENEAILFYNSNGIVIWSTSYYENLNMAKLYAQIGYDDEINFVTKKLEFWDKTYQELVKTPKIEKALASLNDFSHDAFMNIKQGIHISLDCREGMFYKLSEVKKHFTFFKEWTSSPFLWFLDYTEENEQNYDYKAITKEKILKCSPEAQSIMQVTLND